MALKWINGRGMVWVPDPPPAPKPATFPVWKGSAVHFASDPWKAYVAGQQKPAPSAPGAPAPSAPAAPSAGGGELADDAQAAAARAQALFERSQRISALQQQGSDDATDLAEAVRRMREQQPKDEQSAKESRNRQGLFFSGILGKQLGDIATQYTRRQADEQTAFDRRQAARAAALSALEQGAPIDDFAITAALADRATARDQQLAGSGSLVANPEPVAVAPVAPVVKLPKASPAKAFQTIVKRGKVFRLYPGRKPIYIRPATGGR